MSQTFKRERSFSGEGWSLGPALILNPEKSDERPLRVIDLATPISLGYDFDRREKVPALRRTVCLSPRGGVLVRGCASGSRNAPEPPSGLCGLSLRELSTSNGCRQKRKAA